MKTLWSFLVPAPLLALVALSTGCVNSELTPVSGVHFVPLEPGCPVSEFPSTTPNYPWYDVATTQVFCGNRTACVERIRRDVCKAGGDTAYGYKESIDGNASVIVATIAHRRAGMGAATATPLAMATGAASAAPATAQAKAPPTASASDSCDPPCSPGYRCQGSTCTALCNPACGAGMHCAQDRTCQPDAASTPAKSASSSGKSP
jgi:hypothetical protein